MNGDARGADELVGKVVLDALVEKRESVAALVIFNDPQRAVAVDPPVAKNDGRLEIVVVEGRGRDNKRDCDRFIVEGHGHVKNLATICEQIISNPKRNRKQEEKRKEKERNNSKNQRLKNENTK